MSGPWRNPYEYRRLVTVAHVEPGRYDLTVFPGADLHDLVEVTATLPSVVYTDHRRLAPSDPAAVLSFRALPTDPESVAARRSPSGGGPGWLPTLDTAVAGAGPSAYEQAVRTIVTPGAFGRYGRCLVHGLAHCDPAAVLAAAEAIRKARTSRA